MARIKDLSIHTKLNLLVVFTTGSALVVACAALGVKEFKSLKMSHLQQMSAVADVVGANTVAAVTFNDADDAKLVLSSLRLEPNVRYACLYDRDGKPLATYHRSNLSELFTPPTPHNDGHEFTSNNTLEIYKTISDADGPVGTLYLQAGMEQITAKFERYAATAATVLLFSLVVSILLASRMQKVISLPITKLARTAEQISREGDYSIRVKKVADDEIGSLYDEFNRMLTHIEHSERELTEARNELEVRVVERTRQLSETNEKLNGEITERKRAQAKIALLARFPDENPDPVLRIADDGKVLYANQASISCFKSWHIEVGKQVPDELKPWLVRAIQSDTGVSVEIPQDGHVFDILFTHVNESRYVNCYARDITDRKRAEAKLADLNKQLVATSRRAGQAETASSVLHNVGNVLNSVNVSSGLIRDKLRNSGVADLKKVLDILEQHIGDIGPYITQDEQGKHLPRFLIDLGRTIAASEQAVIEEVQSLAKNIDHIKNIIAVQQSLAGNSGIIEEVQLPDILEDAIRINSASAERHRIKIVRQFEDRSPVAVDRQKLLSILVNLVSNAKYALIESNTANKQIVIRIVRAAADRIRIEIEDNGIGIAAENMTRIFSHGFTTRKEGHGFGLHSAALSAEEMDGKLTARSDGPGTGAIFALEIPLIMTVQKRCTIKAT